jgi:hypothetical protein
VEVETNSDEQEEETDSNDEDDDSDQDALIPDDVDGLERLNFEFEAVPLEQGDIEGIVNLLTQVGCLGIDKNGVGTIVQTTHERDDQDYSYRGNFMQGIQKNAFRMRENASLNWKICIDENNVVRMNLI